jgi:hypothetical protein
MIMSGVVEEVVRGDAGVGEQAAREIRSIKKEERSLRMSMQGRDTHLLNELLDGLLKLLERCHPGNLVDEVGEGVALLA